MQVANLIATLLVIAIHYTSKFANGVPLIPDANFYFQEFFTNNIARVAVPFFALSAGFFLFLSFEGMSSYKIMLIKRWKTLLLPYVLASALIYTALLLKQVLGGRLPDFDLISHLYNIVVQPKAGQFWFLRDLILLVLFSPLIYYAVRMTKGAILALIFLLWLFEVQLLPIIGKWYLLNIETLLFFSLGCFFAWHRHLAESLVSIKTSTVVLLTVVWLTLSILRVYLDPVFSSWYRYDYTPVSLMLYKLSILIGIPALITISMSEKFARRRLLFLSAFTFFAYMFHTEPLHDVLHYLSQYITSPEYAFYITYPLATVLVFSGAWFCQQYITPLYMLLTGNRDSGRVLARL